MTVKSQKFIIHYLKSLIKNFKYLYHNEAGIEITTCSFQFKRNGGQSETKKYSPPFCDRSHKNTRNRWKELMVIMRIIHYLSILYFNH